jgi:transposase
MGYQSLAAQFTRNNGITEGFHTQMELIQRRAYGFRNFDSRSEAAITD